MGSPASALHWIDCLAKPVPQFSHQYKANLQGMAVPLFSSNVSSDLRLSISSCQVLKQSRSSHRVMASSLRHLLFFVIMAAVAMVICLPAAANGEVPPGIMSIHNDFPSKLYVQCDSDREHQGVDMVWAQEAHRFNFYPDLDKYWTCTIKTTPMTEEPYTPVPAVWGKFDVYVKNPVFRACYPICVWKADADGLALIIHAGDKPTHIYSWSKQ